MTAQSGVPCTKQQINTIQYFAHTCLEIINVMLENIQKSQLVENEDTYFEFLSTYMFKSKSGDIYKHVGLNKQYPYANGLEPLD